MKKKKISRRIMLALLLLNILSTPLISQKSYYLGPDDIVDFTNQLICDYGDQIDVPASEISAHLRSLLPEGTPDHIPAPEAILLSASSTSASFSWPAVENAQSYTSTFFGLSDGQVESREGPTTEAAFSDLSTQLGLFSFSSTVNDINGIIKVIIVDLEIFHGDYAFRCECSQPSTSLVGTQEVCNTTDHIFFPWQNTCLANKYYFTVSDNSLGGNYSEPFYCVFKDTLPIPKVYVLKHCNPENPPALGDFYFGSNPYFQVMFSNMGVHFYLNTTDYPNLTVLGEICDCYNENEIPHEDSPGPRSSSAASVDLPSTLLVSPNPFNQEIHLALPITIDQPVAILLYDVNGRIVKQLFAQSLNGTLTIPTHDLANGLYNIQVSTSGQSWQQRLIKMN